MRTTRLDGRTIIVTGASSGIGFFIAEGLARLGAHVVVAARSADRAQAAIDLLPDPKRHRHLELDLTSLSSLRSAGTLVGGGDPVDGLVMNAGVITPSPVYRTGLFGVESTVDVNVMAHMEFLRRALPALHRAPSARIVSTGSMLTQKIPFDRANWLAQRSYRPRVAYAMSKNAAEILGFELDRRLVASDSPIRSVVTHPGGAIDALTPDRPPIHQRPFPVRLIAPALTPLFSRLVQGKDAAAQSAVAALTTPTLPPSPYIGPRGGASGPPAFTAPLSSTSDATTGAWLWEEAETILGQSILTGP